MSQADCILCMILNFKTTLLNLKLLSSYYYSKNMRRCQTLPLRKLKDVSQCYDKSSLSYKLSFQTHQISIINFSISILDITLVRGICADTDF